MTYDIKQTSIDAYKDEKPKLGDKQQETYNALAKLGQANNRELANYMKKGINQVTPRIKELREKKLVGVAYQGKDEKTNKTTIYWRCVR